MLLPGSVSGQVSDSPGSVNCAETADLTVTVTTKGGALIQNALVILREDTAGMHKRPKVLQLELRTDYSGKARAAIPCNYFDVLVAQDGFAPAAQKFLVGNAGNAFTVVLDSYPVMRTTEVPTGIPPIGAQTSELPSRLPEPTESAVPSNPILDISKATVLAFFTPVPKTVSKKEAADSNEALADFQFYGHQVTKSLADIGVDYREVYAPRFVVRIGNATTPFRPAKGVGYYFVAPGRKKCVQYGVLTDIDLLHVARECFGVNGTQ
jgi:hypothetical protein